MSKGLGNLAHTSFWVNERKLSTRHYSNFLSLEYLHDVHVTQCGDQQYYSNSSDNNDNINSNDSDNKENGKTKPETNGANE